MISRNSKPETAAEIGKLGATELGPGALIFRSSDKLYIANTPRITAYLSDAEMEQQRPQGLRDTDVARHQPQALRETNGAGHRVYITDPDYAASSVEAALARGQ